MTRHAALCLLVALGACAQPVVHASAIAWPADTVTLRSSGPDGESPSPPAPTPAGRTATVALASAGAVSRDIARLRDRHLVIPVAGVRADQMEDSFTADRDGGERQHNAIDILAPRNTPILAADDGVILRLSSNALGGITVWATDDRREYVYYYAHLDHYDRDMYQGRKLTKGDTIGYVGTTGNAPRNVPHLHFQIMRWPADGKYWIGEPINPYPILHEKR